MTLPLWTQEQNLTLEEALGQFEHATERLVLLPRGKENIRNHVFDAATDATLASSRFIAIFEKDYKTYSNGIPSRFLQGMGRCLYVLEKMRNLYDLMEQQVQDEPKELKKLTREESIINNYASCMVLRSTYVRDLINQITKP